MIKALKEEILKFLERSAGDFPESQERVSCIEETGEAG